jgi:hypothetical protein
VAKKKQSSLKLFERHPVYELLDYYEARARRLLRAKKLPDTLDELGDLPEHDDKGRLTIPARLRRVLWYTERVREAITAGDAEGSARWMHSLARTVYHLDQKRRSTRPRRRTDRRWLDRACDFAEEKRPDANRDRLWKYFAVNHYGQKHGLDIDDLNEPGTPDGEKLGVWFEHDAGDGVLIYNDGSRHDGGNTDEVTLPVFLKFLSRRKMRR